MLEANRVRCKNEFPIKDLTIYVHGANTSVERAAGQAAQYRHFTGRNSVVLFFAWPSAENFMRYATDVANARRSEPKFARLLELLSKHTKAANINVLAYSAGAMVASPGLARLDQLPQGDEHPAVRLGQRDTDQSTTARPARTGTGIGLICGPVGCTQEPAPGVVEELVGLVVHLHRDMGAAVHIGVGLALEADRKRAAGLAAKEHIKRHSAPAFDQVTAITQGQGGVHVSLCCVVRLGCVPRTPGSPLRECPPAAPPP